MKSLYALATLFIAVVMAHESSSEGDVESSLLPELIDGAASANFGELKANHAANVQIVSNVAHHRCVQYGHVTPIFEGIDAMNTPTLAKSIKRQLEVAFFVPSTSLADNTTLANAQALLRNNHVIGHRFNPAYDAVLATLTEEKVNAELASAEVHHKKAFNQNLQYVMFAFGTPEFALKVAERRSLRVVHHNLDFSSPDANLIGTLDANFVSPAHQSFITLQNSHNPKQWDTLRTTYNAAVARKFTPVRLSTCLPPLRDAGASPQAITDVNPAKPPVNNPQPINNNNNASNMAAGISVQTALIGCAVALAILVFA